MGPRGRLFLSEVPQGEAVSHEGARERLFLMNELPL